jgi:hypothetical protein
MRRIAIATLVVTVSAGCSMPPEKQFNPNACAVQGPAVTAPDRVTISGTLKDIAQRIPISGAAVEGISVRTAVELFQPTLTTDSHGSFSGSHSTAGMPLDEYLRITAPPPSPASGTLYFGTYYYPADAVAGNLDVGELQVFSDHGLQLIVGAYAIPMQQAPDMTNKGILTVGVTDCSGAAVGGATVTTSIPPGAGGDVHYLGSDSLPSPTANRTDAVFGVALIFNVPEDMITISAIDAMGTQLHAHAVPGKKGAVVETTIHP